MGDCNVTKVAQLVKTQVGFDVVLLDSKLYKLLNNDSMSGPDYMGKIIAAKHAMYERLVGVSGGSSGVPDDDNVVVVEPPPAK